jgi:hypothetical protein
MPQIRGLSDISLEGVTYLATNLISPYLYYTRFSAAFLDKLAIRRSPTALATLRLALFRGEAPHRRVFHPDTKSKIMVRGFPSRS